MVYRLVADQTIEEKVLALQERTWDLFDSVIDAGMQLDRPGCRSAHVPISRASLRVVGDVALEADVVAGIQVLGGPAAAAAPGTGRLVLADWPDLSTARPARSVGLPEGTDPRRARLPRVHVADGLRRRARRAESVV